MSVLASAKQFTRPIELYNIEQWYDELEFAKEAVVHSQRTPA
jgi:hypothetical protein